MMEHRVELEYRLSAGRLQPWIDALREGRALGLACSECHRVAFPPARRCACGSSRSDWAELPGTATIVERSDGPEAAFALARFDGADTLATVRIDDSAGSIGRGRLKPVPDGPPALIITADTKDPTT
jgi:uncharacterized OB-fold protein